MAKKWIALNILLLVAAVGLSRELYRKYEQFETKSDSVRIEPIPVDNQAGVKTALGISTDTFMETPIHADVDYFIISEKTLFSEMRGREEDALPVVSAPVPPLQPRPVLVGTIMVDGQYTASIMDPGSTSTRGAQIVPETRRVGDMHRGYKITSIEAEHIVLENGGRREVITLNRTARRVQPAKPATVSARVVSIGTGGGASGAVNVATTAAAAPGGRTPQTAAQIAAQVAALNREAAQNAATRQAKPGQNQNAPIISTSPDGTVTVVPQPVQAAPPNQQKVQPAQKTQPAQKAQQRRTVPSPFGDIIRPGSE